MDTDQLNAEGNPAIDWRSIKGGVEILLIASCYGNRDKLQPDGPLGSYTDCIMVVNPLLYSALCIQTY